MRPTPRLLLALLACAPIICVSFAQERPKPTPEQLQAQQDYLKQQETLRSRFEAILAEIADIKSGKIGPGADWAKEWAGSYQCNDGHSTMTIAIAPRAGMAFSWNSHGTQLDFNYGQIIEATHGSILVGLERPIEPGGVEFFSERLYFVRWGEERFLLPRPPMLSLIDWMNRGRGGFTMLRMPAAVARPFMAAPPPGLPEIPDELRPLVFAAPLDITLTKVRQTELTDIGARTRCWKFEVTIDKGRLDGIHENIRLDKPWGLPGSLVFTKLDDRASEARLILVTTDADRAGHPVVGDTLSLPAGARALPRARDPDSRESFLVRD